MALHRWLACASLSTIAIAFGPPACDRTDVEIFPSQCTTSPSGPLAGEADGSYCAPTCTSDSDCPQVGGGTTASCTMNQGYSTMYCEYKCETDSECPGAAVCQKNIVSKVCTYLPDTPAPEGFVYVGEGVCCAEEGCSSGSYPQSDGPTLTSDNAIQCSDRYADSCGGHTVFDICAEMDDCLAVTIVGTPNNIGDCQVQLISNSRCKTLCDPGSYPLCQRKPDPKNQCGNWYGNCGATVSDVVQYNFSSGRTPNLMRPGSQQRCYRKASARRMLRGSSDHVV